MKIKQLLLGTVIIGVIWNIADFILQGIILKSTYESISGYVSMDSINPVWWILFDFIQAFLVTWFFRKVMSSFERSPQGAMLFGVFLAIILAVPTVFIEGITVKGFPMWLAWLWLVQYIIYGAVAGYILGMLSKPKIATA